MTGPAVTQSTSFEAWLNDRCIVQAGIFVLRFELIGRPYANYFVETTFLFVNVLEVQSSSLLKPSESDELEFSVVERIFMATLLTCLAWRVQTLRTLQWLRRLRARSSTKIGPSLEPVIISAWHWILMGSILNCKSTWRGDGGARKR